MLWILIVEDEYTREELAVEMDWNTLVSRLMEVLARLFAERRVPDRRSTVGSHTDLASADI